MARRNRKAGRDPLSVLATGLLDNDNVRVGLAVAKRRPTATKRETISRKFVAPRIEMGEYTPVSTHALEVEKTLRGWTA